MQTMETIPADMTIRVPYTLIENGVTVFVERNASEALKEAQDKVRACETVLSRLEVSE